MVSNHSVAGSNPAGRTKTKMSKRKDDRQDPKDEARAQRKKEWDYGYLKANIEQLISGMSDEDIVNLMRWAKRDTKRLKLKTLLFKPSSNDGVDAATIEVIIQEFRKRNLKLD